MNSSHIQSTGVEHHCPIPLVEVSEYVVSGPLFRTPTALQPPRTAVAGVRVSF